VRKAKHLQPDILTLDIGLPGFNGIEAAKLVRRQSPHTKIVFITQCADDDIRETALEAGGVAYVLKGKATTDLSPAIDSAQAAAASDRQPVSVSSRT
jgi:DNA-binding NarL/FixJ family response regulator